MKITSSLPFLLAFVPKLALAAGPPKFTLFDSASNGPRFGQNKNIDSGHCLAPDSQSGGLVRPIDCGDPSANMFYQPGGQMLAYHTGDGNADFCLGVTSDKKLTTATCGFNLPHFHLSGGHLMVDSFPGLCAWEEADEFVMKPCVPSAAVSSVPSTTSLVPAAVSPATRTASSSGDPHFKTWIGDKFDFHGGCDLVLLRNGGFASGLGMDIHIRTKIETWWSYIHSASLRIGLDTFEVTGGADGGSYWHNGKPGKKPIDGEHLHVSGFIISYHQVTAKQKRYRVELGNGDAIGLETYKDFVRVSVHANTHNQFKESLGLLGSYPDGKKVARDAITVIEDVSAFGLQWQVLASEPMLFHSVEGVQHPEVCAMPDTTTKRQRRLGESLITKEDAEAACARVDDDDRDACIFDVLATNDKDMAGSY